jgi:hypothetical protein
MSDKWDERAEKWYPDLHHWIENDVYSDAFIISQIAKFASSAADEARREENEACAKVVYDDDGEMDDSGSVCLCSKRISEAVRARLASAPAPSTPRAPGGFRRAIGVLKLEEGETPEGLVREMRGHAQDDLINRAGKAEADRDAVEQLRVQLAGCSVAALGGISEPVLAHIGDYGWSPAYQDVLDLRNEYESTKVALEKAEADAAAMRQACKAARHSLTTVHGLVATDKIGEFDPGLKFTIDEQNVISEIDSALATDAGARVLAVVEAVKTLSDKLTDEEIGNGVDMLNVEWALEITQLRDNLRFALNALDAKEAQP